MLTQIMFKYDYRLSVDRGLVGSLYLASSLCVCDARWREAQSIIDAKHPALSCPLSFKILGAASDKHIQSRNVPSQKLERPPKWERIVF